MISVPFYNYSSFRTAEEFYSLFLFLKKEFDADILDCPNFRAYYFFDVLVKYNFIDKEYVSKINKNLGSYFTGEKNKKAILDINSLIDFVYQRESLSGRTKEDIKDFFVYHVAHMLEQDDTSYFEKSLLDSFSTYFKSLGIEKTESLKINIVPIPKKVKEMKLIYRNLDDIYEKFDFLEENIKDKNCLEILKNIKIQLID